MKQKVGNDVDNPHFGYPEEVLEYIREIVPGNIKGEILETAFVVSLEQFCESLGIPKL